MNTRKNCPVTFAPNDDIDGAMCETEESVKGRICRLFGFTSEHLSIQEGFLESAKFAGTRYFAYTSVHFTANDIGWSTDFENLTRDPVFDEL